MYSNQYLWKCDKEHEFEMTLTSMIKGDCIFCGNRNIKKGESLEEKFPDIAKEWHPTKNYDLKPNMVTAFSSKRTTWTCKNKHIWREAISSRTMGNTICQTCKNEEYLKINSLLVKNPDIAKEWHPTKNDISANEVSFYSKTKFWWKCKQNNHEWLTTVLCRSNGSGCPCCLGRLPTKENNFAMLYPKLIKDWNPLKNNITPFDILPTSKKIINWICKYGHKWISTVAQKTKGASCPICYGRCVSEKNSLANNYPELIKEWHQTKNDKPPKYYAFGSAKKVWWTCSEGHSWEACINGRVNGNGCPYCGNRQLCDSNSLLSLRPDLAKEWHPTKNKLTPLEVTTGTNFKALWTCSKGHQWKASIYNRCNGSQCLYCVGHLVCDDNSFESTYPEISKEWDYKKNNGFKPSDVTVSSHKKAWFKCKEGHSWKTRIYHRSKGAGCPMCSRGSVSKPSIEWLEGIMKEEDIFIKHGINVGEHKIKLGNDKITKVDGYCEETNTVYEYNGCYFHGDQAKNCKTGNRTNPDDKHPLSKTTYKELYEKTLKREQMIRDAGYNLEVIWECEHKYEIIREI